MKEIALTHIPNHAPSAQRFSLLKSYFLDTTIEFLKPPLPSVLILLKENITFSDKMNVHKIWITTRALEKYHLENK